MDEAYLKVLRSELRQELRNNLAGQKIVHPALSQPIEFSWQGIKHCISSTSIEPLRQFHALGQMPQLMQKATYAHTEADNHLPPRAGVFMHTFYADCQLDEQPYTVWLRVRETPDSIHFYDLGVVR